MDRNANKSAKAEVSTSSGLSNSRSCADLPRSFSGGLALTQRIEALGADHREILELVISKAEAGAKKYGLLDLATDERDFEAEARAELVDCVHYLGAEVVKLKRENARLRVEARLAELAAAPAQDLTPRFDLGGES